MIFQTFVHGIPKAQPRPRAFHSQGKTRVFTPGTAEAWKASIAVACGPAIGSFLDHQPVSISITLYLPRPRHHFRSNGLLKDTAPLFHTSKPDVDNLAKAVLDCLSHIGIWSDDAIIAHLSVRKEYGREIGARICISNELSETTKQGEQTWQY